MTWRVDAIYQDGVLRPVKPLSLADSQRVRLTVSTGPSADDPRLDSELLEQARAEVAAMKHIPTIEEVRAALAAIPGNLSEDVSAERGEY